MYCHNDVFITRFIKSLPGQPCLQMPRSKYIAWGTCAFCTHFTTVNVILTMFGLSELVDVVQEHSI